MGQERLSWVIGGLTSGAGLDEGHLNDEAWITDISTSAATREALESCREVSIAHEQGLAVEISQRDGGSFALVISFPGEPRCGQYDNPLALAFYKALLAS